MVRDLSTCPDSYPTSWRQFLAHRFDGESFKRLLEEYANRFPEGTMAAEVGKAMARERRKGVVMGILLREITALRKTVRVDGIMPLSIPVATDICEIADELLFQLRRLHYDVPEGGEALRRMQDEIAVCYLAFFHRREIEIDYTLRMRVQVECPYSPTSGRRQSLMLMGYLPFGGRITVFYSSLLAEKWLAMPGSAVEHEPGLEAVRSGDRLLLEPV